MGTCVLSISVEPGESGEQGLSPGDSDVAALSRGLSLSAGGSCQPGPGPPAQALRGPALQRPPAAAAGAALVRGLREDVPSYSEGCGCSLGLGKWSGVETLNFSDSVGHLLSFSPVCFIHNSTRCYIC